MGGFFRAARSVTGGIAGAVQSIGRSLGSALSNAISAARSVTGAVAENPVPVIETIALTYVGVPPTVAAAAVSAANGGTPRQIATAAAAAYVGSEVSSATGSSVAAAGASDATVQIASSAAGASASAVTSAIASGKPLDEALKEGATAAVVGAAAGGVAEGVKSSLAEPISGTGLKGTISTVPTTTDQFGVKADYSFAPQQAEGISARIPTTGGQGLYADPNAILPSSLSAYRTAPSQMKVGEDGGLTTRYQDASASVVPESLQQYITKSTGEAPQTTASPQTVSPIGKFEESAIKSLVGSGLSSLLRPSVPGTTGASPTTYSGQPTTGVTAGLGGARGGAGDVESSETGGKRRNVWNEASLRLTDALGI